jgi:hypothetical protein
MFLTSRFPFVHGYSSIVFGLLSLCSGIRYRLPPIFLIVSLFRRRRRRCVRSHERWIISAISPNKQNDCARSELNFGREEDEFY